MKTLIKVLLLFLLSQHLCAQRLSVVNSSAPEPAQKSPNEAVFLSFQRPLLSSLSRRESGLFLGRKMIPRSPGHIKYVGDNTALYGCVVFSGDWTQNRLDYGIYGMQAKRGFEFDTIKVDNFFKTNSAVYAGDKYYLFHVEQALGSLVYVECSAVNTDTWTLEKTFTPPIVWDNVPYASSLSQDPTSGKVYAITYATEGTYALSTLNVDDGSFTKVCDVERSYIAIAISGTGELYGIADSGQLYTIDKQNGKSEYIGDTGLTPKYAQGMAFDYSTNQLYWTYMDEEKSGLYQVNTSTATAYKIDDMPHLEEVLGLFVPQEKIGEQAPSSVTELKFEPISYDAATGKVSCVAPNTMADGSPLTQNVQVSVYSGDELILQETVAPGVKVEKDNVDFGEDNLYTIYAQASNEYGVSKKSSVTTYIGVDLPSAPQNVNLVISDKKAHLTWNAPDNGLHDGFIDIASLSYKVIRYDGGENGVLVAQTAPGTCTFAEDIPAATAKYKYAVTAVNAKGEGGTALSNEVLSVGAYELPFYDNFSDGEVCNALYTFIDVDQDGHDNQCMWFWKEDEKLVQYCSDNVHAGNDWFITPAIHLDAKNLYNLAFNVNMGSPSNLKVTIGTSPDPATQKIVLDLHDIYDPWQTEYTASIQVPGDSIYYIGFYNYNNPESFYFNLFDIKLEKGMETTVSDSVSAFSVVPGELGELSAKLSFVTPEKRLIGDSMPASFEVVVYRNDDTIARKTVSPGQTVNLEDKPSKGGEYTYKVVACMGEKEGLSASRTVWVGEDISEPVHDMKAVTIDGNIHVKLTWNQPEKGVHGGYFNVDDITYSVWRSLNKKDFNQIATGLEDCGYVDNQISEELAGSQDGYYYAVTAETKSGSSEKEIVFIVVGEPYEFPVSESFPNGQFNITPWTVKAITGNFSWECTRDDVSAGVFAQDGDNGMSKFYNFAGDNQVDSRLISPAISLKGSTNPVFSFFMFHWLESTVEYDNRQTKIVIEVAPENDDFEVVSDTITAAYPVFGWVEHRIPLEKYKDKSYIKIGLRGSTDNSWMYYYIDNIHVDEQYDNDLAISGFEGPQEVAVNDTCHYLVNYYNRGLNDAEGYNINLYQDDVLLKSVPGETIKPGEMREVEIQAPVNATKVGKECEFYAEISFVNDQDLSNNKSKTVYTRVQNTWYPGVENLEAKSDGHHVDLDWTAPVLPTTDQVTEDDVESYDAFAIDNIGDWVTYDGDGLGCGKLTNLPQFPNSGKNQAFQVWNPGQIEGVTPESFPQLQPHSGEQCFISWYANVSYDGAIPCNNDYLISPEVKGGTELSFFIREINPTTEGETYEIMYSSTTQDPDQFTKIVDKEAGPDWEKVSVTLPEDAKYFAIRYTASLKTGILVDDISYTSGLYALELKGYNIFRDGQQLNEELVQNVHYVDADVPDGEYGYQVSTIYNRGESKASPIVYIDHKFSGIVHMATDDSGIQMSIDGNCLTIKTLKTEDIAIYAVDGKVIFAGSRKGVVTCYLPAGVYIVNINGRNEKIVIGG